MDKYLSKADEDALIARAAESSAAMLAVVERYEPLIKSASHARYLRAVASAEELESIARLALIEAVHDYTADCGAYFAAFAARRVETTLYGEFRRARREWERTSRPDQSDNAADFWEVYGGSAPAADTPEVVAEERALVAQATAILTPEEKRLLGLLFCAELTLRQIAPIMQRSHQSLTKAKKRLLEKMRAALEPAPIPAC